MRRVVPVAMLVLATLPAAAGAVGPNQLRDGRAPYDDRSAPVNANRIAEPPAAREAAVADLLQSLGARGQVQLDRVTATPRNVAKLNGFLTGRSSKSPASIALSYVADHRDVFGLSAGDIDKLDLVRTYTDILGTTHLTWAQTVDGIPTIDNGIRAAVAKDGRLVNVQGAPVPGLSLKTTEPALSAGQALDAARADAGATGPRPALQRKNSGGRRSTSFAGDNEARLSIYETFGGPRLVWRVMADKASTQLYAYVIDARTGEVLKRENTVEFASGLAWDYFPGPIPLNNAGVATSRDFTAKGWLAANATTLSGNNTHTYFDLLDDNTADVADEVPPSSGNAWNYSLSRFNDGSFFVNCDTNFPCSWDSSVGSSWQTNSRQNATQIFYFVNNFHDHLQAAPIGFTEAAGNFQVTNSTGQGAGGDAVQAQVLDGANTDNGFPDNNHFNNANMNTPRDGQPPRMQMYLMTGMQPNGGDVNSGDDASVIYHEYTHGLSNRLVTDNDGNPALGTQQGRSMGEGWADFYALDYLVDKGYDADTADVGDVNTGFYIAGGVGFRTQPLDCPVGSNDGDCTNFNGAGDGGYSYDDFGKVIGAPEVHADGEIWHQTMWELRQQLIAKYGVAAGTARARTYITRGMELSPPFPSFIDMRNGILQAETVATATGGPYAGTDDDDVLWGTFARRGMGYFAAAIDGNDVTPVASFAQPPAAGAPRGTLSGTVTLTDGGVPAVGARVEIGGHNSGLASDLAATTDPTGAYSIANVPNGSYPYAFVGGPGFDRVRVNTVNVNGATTLNFQTRRNWAQRDGGGTVDSFSPPDLSTNGCGPNGAIDGTQGNGWGSTSPTSTQGPGGAKSITIHLPQAITLSQFAVDPGATCGDDDNASVGSYKIETSSNGTAFTQTNAGTFTAAHNHKLNILTPGAGTANVRYVRFTMNAPQSTAGSGADWMDMSELKVYGVAAGTGAVGGLSATGGTKQVSLNWNDTPGATGYKVFRRDDGGTTYPATPTATTTASEYVDANRADGTQYCYKVLAVGGAGDGELSSEACATTLGTATPTSTATATATATSTTTPGGGGGGGGGGSSSTPTPTSTVFVPTATATPVQTVTPPPEDDDTPVNLTGVPKSLKVKGRGSFAFTVAGTPNERGSVSITSRALGKLAAKRFVTPASGQLTIKIKLAKKKFKKLKKAGKTKVDIVVKIGSLSATKTVKLTPP